MVDRFGIDSGGLASAASVVANLPAVTFNAAGLHNNTLQAAPSSFILDTVAYQAAVNRYNSNGGGLITAYHVDYDLLSNLQDWVPTQYASVIPSALGNRICLDGRYDLQMNAWWTLLAASYFSTSPLAVIAAHVIGGAAMLQAGIQCHLCEELLYGFLVKEGGSGSIIEDLLGL